MIAFLLAGPLRLWRFVGKLSFFVTVQVYEPAEPRWHSASRQGKIILEERKAWEMEVVCRGSCDLKRRGQFEGIMFSPVEFGKHKIGAVSEQWVPWCQD